MSTRPCRPVYRYLVHNVKPACEDDYGDDGDDDDDDDGDVCDDGDDGGAHSITGTGSPLTAAHNHLNSLGEHRPDSVLCSAVHSLLLAAVWDRGGRIPSQRWPPTNSIREKSLKLTLRCINRILARCGPLVIATPDRWSRPKQFGNPEMLNNHFWKTFALKLSGLVWHGMR